MRFYAFLFIFSALISACGPKEDAGPVLMDRPDDLIPEEQMIQVLADVHLLEACLQYRAPRVQSRSPFMGGGPQPPMMQNVEVAPLPTDQKTMPYYDIFKKRGCTRDQFDRSLRWYMLDAEAYGAMYDEVINELVRRQAYEQGGVVPPADSTK